MRDISATATATADKPIDHCFAHLRDIDRYPEWYPDGAKQVQVA